MLQVRKVVQDTLKNVHPIYNIKTLMIKRELSKDPELKDQSWERFLPKFNKTHAKKAKKPKIKKKEYTPFPPPQTESKIDKQLASGEYFLHEKERRLKSLQAKKVKENEAEEKRAARRQQAFIPPVESSKPKKGSKKNDNHNNIDVETLKKKVKISQKRKRAQGETTGTPSNRKKVEQAEICETGSYQNSSSEEAAAQSLCQGVSSTLPLKREIWSLSPAPGEGKKRDPGNEFGSWLVGVEASFSRGPDEMERCIARRDHLPLY